MVRFTILYFSVRCITDSSPTLTRWLAWAKAVLGSCLNHETKWMTASMPSNASRSITGRPGIVLVSTMIPLPWYVSIINIASVYTNDDDDDSSKLQIDDVKTNFVKLKVGLLMRFNRNYIWSHSKYKSSWPVECGRSSAECRTRNRERLGSNPLCYHFKVWAFLFSPRCSSSLSYINEYLSMDGGGNVTE